MNFSERSNTILHGITYDQNKILREFVDNLDKDMMEMQLKEKDEIGHSGPGGYYGQNDGPGYGASSSQFLNVREFKCNF